MKKALICIDFIKEIVGAEGKLSGKGYLAFTEQHNTLSNLANAQTEMRNSGGRVIHVHLGFANDYADHPSKSLLLGGARNGGILKLGSVSTEIHPVVAPQSDDLVIVKKRISAFYGTSLELALRSLEVDEVLIAGVATDLAVQSAARDAHDRDFTVSILANSCAAANDQDHNEAIKNLAKFATIL